MSENQSHQSPRRTLAAIRQSRWPGWIWSIPIAVIIVVAWLAFRYIAEGATDITITFDDAHGIQAKNTNVEFRGMKVGQVTDVSLSRDGTHVDVTAAINSDAVKFLRSGTTFWLQGANPSLSNLASLGAILSGPTIEMQPGSGTKTTHFVGLAHKPAVPGATGKPALFAVSFTGAVGSIAPGQVVTLKGFPVGEVRDVGFHYDPSSGKLATPVTLALYPAAFHLKDRAALKAALSKLVSEGLRANLDRTPPLVGSYQVSLELVPGAPSAQLASNQPIPEIPTAPSGGLQSILTRFNKVPIDQIAQNVLDATKHADQILASPKLADSVAQLDASLKDIHRTTAAAGPKIVKLVAQLRSTADQIDLAARAADKTLGATPSQTGLHSTMQEISEAARSVRELADYLDRHPEALIQGRSG